jgi:hypothetical protein
VSASLRHIPPSCIRVFVILMLAMTSLVAGPKPDAHAGNGPQNFRNARIAEVARADNGQQRPTGWNQPGECIKWVQSWVSEAGGNLPGGTGPIAMFQNAGAVEIALDAAQPGDIFQRSKGNTWDGTPHTGVIGSTMASDGTFEIIEGNYDFKGTVRVTRFRPTNKPEHELHVWRLGQLGPSAPTGNYDGASVPSNGRVHVAGWAFDTDDTNAALSMHLYLGGQAGAAGTMGHNLGVANARRDDVHRVYGTGSNHGFSFTIDTPMRGNQPACLYAIDVRGGGNRFLGCKAVNLDGPTRTVSMRAVENNRYVSSELEYGSVEKGMLRARATQVGSWETFQILGDCAVRCQIRSAASGLIVSGEFGREGAAYGQLRARANRAYGWEMFKTVGNCATGCALQSLHTGLFVSAELDYTGAGYAMLRARAGQASGWEQFIFTDLGQTQPTQTQPTEPTRQPTANRGTTLSVGQRLEHNQYLEAAGYRFVLQADQNLVLYNPSRRAVWASNTVNSGATFVAMQRDGNLVAYRADGRPVWASGTAGSGANRLIMQRDGNGVLYRADSRAVWATNTVGH